MSVVGVVGLGRHRVAASSVHQHIDAAEALHRGVDGRVDRPPIGDIAPHRDPWRSQSGQFSHRRRRGVVVEVGDDHGRTLGGQPSHTRAANPVPPAGDHRPTSLESFHAVTDTPPIGNRVDQHSAPAVASLGGPADLVVMRH